MGNYQQKSQQTQTAIALTSQERTAIAVYAPEIQQAVEQYKAGLKIKDATVYEYVALAVLCRNHDLDPYNGEAWIIPGSGVMVGVKGSRKAAAKQLTKGAYYNPNPRMLQHSEYANYGLDEETPPMAKVTRWSGGQKTETYETNPIVLVYLCELTRSDAKDVWIAQAEKLTAMTGSYEKAIEALGPRPTWTGIGIVRKHDKSKMEIVQLARKRSESDALKQAFNLPFAVDVERGGDELAQAGDVIDGEIVRNSDKSTGKPSQLAEVVETEVVEEVEEIPVEPEMTQEPTPEPAPEPPATKQKPVVSSQVAPVVGGKLPVPQPPKAAQKPKVNPEGKKAEKPTGPIKDTGEDIDLLALKRCKPDTWVIAAEMLNKELKVHFTAGQLREAVDKKTGALFTPMSPSAWQTAVEVAQEASKSK